jgi:hypothetical protein
VPEFKVRLPPMDGRASQNDIFVLAKSLAGAPVVVMVEGKVNESFGQTLHRWLQDAGPGRLARLEFLVDMLGLKARPDAAIRYQLLHRAVSALLTAEQYRAVAALIVIHSFSGKRRWYQDYQAFTRLFGVKAELGCIQRLSLKNPSGVPLFGVWVEGNPCYLQC